jgi:hypothetical protein
MERQSTHTRGGPPIPAFTLTGPGTGSIWASGSGSSAGLPGAGTTGDRIGTVAGRSTTITPTSPSARILRAAVILTADTRGWLSTTAEFSAPRRMSEWASVPTGSVGSVPQAPCDPILLEGGSAAAFPEAGSMDASGSIEVQGPMEVPGSMAVPDSMVAGAAATGKGIYEDENRSRAAFVQPSTSSVSCVRETIKNATYQSNTAQPF